MPRVAIIGTAGRTVEDAKRLSASLLNLMAQKAVEVMKDSFQLDCKSVTLVSGGSAWSDHVAVRLWLDDPEGFAGLRLFLPCAFDAKTSQHPQFVDTGGDWRTNPGRALNTYHRQFSQKAGFSSLSDLVAVRALGAQFISTAKSFHERNSQVALAADYLIAFTWGPSETKPKDGGTLDTWNKCKGVKIHIPLSLLDQPLVTQKRKTPEENTAQKEPDVHDALCLPTDKKQRAQ